MEQEDKKKANDICKQCKALQLMMKYQDKMMKYQDDSLDFFKQVLQLESQLESLGVRPCTKENGAVIINIKQYVI